MSFRNQLNQVGDAIEYAAATLPEGYIVIIQVEKGAAWVELQDPEGSVREFNDFMESIADDVKTAADTARNREQNEAG